MLAMADRSSKDNSRPSFLFGVGRGFSAAWWGGPGVAIGVVGLIEIATGTYGPGVGALILGGVLIWLGAIRYRRDGHL